MFIFTQDFINLKCECYQVQWYINMWNVFIICRIITERGGGGGGGLHRIFTPTERGGRRCMSNFNTQTHTHTHTEIDKERERERERGGAFTSNICTHTHTHTHTQMGMGLYECIHRIFRERERQM